jgi:hypothetical protein
MSKTKLGFVRLQAAEVVERSQDLLTTIAARREDSRKKFVANFTGQPGGLRRLFGCKPWTEEEAVKHIKDDTWLSHEYWYLTPKFVSNQQQSLQQLINVGYGLMNGHDTLMEVSIEVANWLFPDVQEQI